MVAITGAVAALLLGSYLTGPEAFAFLDVGGDTFVQFYPLQILNVKQVLAHGLPTWSHDLGLGILAQTLDPWRLLALLWPLDKQLQARGFIYLAQIVSASAFFFAYLREVGACRSVAGVGALSYAFCGYMMVNGQWDASGPEVPLFALLLLGIERFWRSRKPAALVVAGLLLGLHHPFNLYTGSLFLVAYITLRQLILQREGPRQFVRTGLTAAAFYCAGLMLAAPILLPSLAALFDSPRVSGTARATGLFEASFRAYDLEAIRGMVAGLFDKSVIGIGDSYSGWRNFLEGPGFYVGLLPLLLAPQLLARAATAAEKRLAIATAVLLALYFTFPLLRHATYGFGHIGYRLSTLWISLLILVAGVAGLRRAVRGGLSVPLLAAAATAVTAMLLWVAGSSALRVDMERVTMLIAFGAAYVTVLVVSLRPTTSRLPVLMLGSLVALELLITAYPNLHQRRPVRSDQNLFHDPTLAALVWLRINRPDLPLHRVDKDYDSVFLMDGIVQGYRGVASYYSHGSSLIGIQQGFGLPRPVPHSISYIGHAADQAELMRLLGVKYLISRSRRSYADWNLIYDSPEVRVFEDPAAQGLAQFRTSVVTEESIAALPAQQRTRIAQRHLIVPEGAPLSLPRSEPAAVNASAAQPAGTPVPVRITRLEDTRIDAAINAPASGLAVFAVPFDRGWSATVDGAAVKPLRVNYGFIGVPVDTGGHEVGLAYYPPFRGVGWTMAGAALILLYLARRRNR